MQSWKGTVSVPWMRICQDAVPASRLQGRRQEPGKPEVSRAILAGLHLTHTWA